MLQNHGVDTVFSYPSETNLPLLDAFARADGLRIVQPQLEDSIGHLASGYAKACGRPAVICAGGGAAGVSLLSGMLDAHLDSAPMIVITGQVRREWIGRDALRESDLVGLSTAVGKHGFRLTDPRDAQATMEAAVKLATTGRQGVVLVEVPEDVQLAESPQRPLPTLLRGYQVPGEPAQNEIESLVSAIEQAKRPLLLLGGGALESARSWARAAETFRLPVATSFTGKGSFPESHPQSLGVAGCAGRRAAMYALSTTDCLIAVGCRFSDRLFGDERNLLRDGLTICQVDIDPFELGKNVPIQVEVRGDAQDVADRLLALGSEYEASTDQVEWLNCCATAAGFFHRGLPTEPHDGVHPRDVMAALNAWKRSSDIVVTGTGMHHLFAAHYLSCQQPRTFLSSAGAATKGTGIPRAIGAAIAKPGDRVLLIDGEVSFAARIQELLLAQQLGLSITAVVLDNGSMGWIQQVSEEKGQSGATTTAGTLDFLAVARAVGVRTVTVDSIESLTASLDESLAAGGPGVIRVPVSPEIRMSPMMPIGGRFEEFDGVGMEGPGMFFSDEELSIMQESAFGREDVEP